MDRSARIVFILILVVLPCGLVFADSQLEIGPDLFVGNQPRGSSFIDPTQATTTQVLIHETYTLSLKVAEYLNILIPADSVVRSAEVIGSAGLSGLRGWKYQGTFSLRCYQFAQIGLDLMGAGWDEQSVVNVRIQVDRNAKNYVSANSDPLSDKIIERLLQNPVTMSLSFGNIEHANEWRGYPILPVVTKAAHKPLPQSKTDYVIVASEALGPSVAIFTQWKSSQGIQSYVMTTHSIDDGYAGNAIQSRTLEFLKDAFNTWHMQYVLMIGGKNTLPPIGFSRSMSGSVEQVTADYYYMTLEQPSNSYDQTQDTILATQYPVDFPDFILGRFPSDNPTDIKNMVEKTIQYESDNNPGDWIQKKLLVTGEGIDVISSDPNAVTLPSYTDWLKYTEEPRLHLIYPQNLTVSSLVNAINQGVGSVSINAHANPYGWVLSSTANKWFDYDDVDLLSNTRLTVIFSEGCHSGKWDATYSVAVNLLASPKKGAVAMIAGSWYTPWALDVYYSAYNYYWKSPAEKSRIPNADYNIGKAFYYFVTLNGFLENMDILGDPSLVIPAQMTLTDFSLSNNGGITVDQGGSGSNTLTVTLTSGSAQPVSLSCTSGLPTGAMCSSNPSSGVPSFQSVLTITTTSLTPTGSSVVTVTGMGGGRIHTTTFPLVVQYSQFFSLSNRGVRVSSNSTVTNLQFDSLRRLINFTIGGPSGTRGFTSVIFAKDLISGNPIVLIDNGRISPIALSLSSNSTHYLFSFAYPHSTHSIAIGGSNTIPEFGSYLFPLVVVVLSLTFMIVGRSNKLRRKKKNEVRLID